MTHYYFLHILQAEIDHALKHNQKIKITEQENEAAWEAANNIEDQGEAVPAAPLAMETEAEAEPELLPDNFYHEQLRRLSAKSPLSTTKFVPPTGSRSAKGSKSGSKTGSRTGSRDSSRDGRSPSRSRTASPVSPQRPGALQKVVSGNTLSGPISPSPGQGKLQKDVEGEGDDKLDDFQRNDSTYVQHQHQHQQHKQQQRSTHDPFPPLQQSSSLPLLHHSQSQVNLLPSSKMAQSQQSQAQWQSQRIPKQEVMPAGTARLRDKLRSKQQKHNQEELKNFLKHKYEYLLLFMRC